jgi:DNA-binding CsgD family transcriptional regulator
MKMAPVITLSDEERKTLEAWSRGRSTQARRVSRAKVVLMAADGMTNESIAAELGTSKPTVGRWRSRFASRGLRGLKRTQLDPDGSES